MLSSSVCANCKYFLSNGDESGGGQCRRRPPTPLVVPQKHAMTGEITGGVMSVHPPVDANQTCGEWDEVEMPDPTTVIAANPH